uniref:Uncharacterized protein n=1 Tax=Arundo donax TaxID=35708 RepID=A0A0A9DC16_ARUDO
MAAGGRSVACCAAVLLAAVLLLSAPATTGSTLSPPSHSLTYHTLTREPVRSAHPIAVASDGAGSESYGDAFASGDSAARCPMRPPFVLFLNLSPRLVGTISVGGSSAESVPSNFDPTGLQFSSILRACPNYESKLSRFSSPQLGEAHTWSCPLGLTT